MFRVAGNVLRCWECFALPGMILLTVIHFCFEDSFLWFIAVCRDSFMVPRVISHYQNHAWLAFSRTLLRGRIFCRARARVFLIDDLLVDLFVDLGVDYLSSTCGLPVHCLLLLFSNYFVHNNYILHLLVRIGKNRPSGFKKKTDFIGFFRVSWVIYKKKNTERLKTWEDTISIE